MVGCALSEKALSAKKMSSLRHMLYAVSQLHDSIKLLKKGFFEIPPFDLRGLIDENINVHNNIKVG